MDELKRRIPIHSAIVPILKQLLAELETAPRQRRTTRQTNHNQEEPDTRPLFPFTRMTAFRIIREASLRSGIRTQDGRLVHPHALRHTFAIHWIRAGGKIEMLQRYLGHADPKTTSIYLTFAPSDLEKEQARLF